MHDIKTEYMNTRHHQIFGRKIPITFLPSRVILVFIGSGFM